jgi:flagellar basal-body rod protein FlgB
MLDLMTKGFSLHADALQLRAERQKLLASNIANADTPNYKARDFDFGKALSTMRMNKSNEMPVPAYRVTEQASIDGNTVDMDKERANFMDNSVRYESTLRFINSNIRQMLTAIKGE